MPSEIRKYIRTVCMSEYFVGIENVLVHTEEIEKTFDVLGTSVPIDSQK